jgi:L-amino acid N-acyltransferase YncA
VEIREAHEPDWPAIWPIVNAVVTAGDTYAYPEPLSEAEASSLWMEEPPARTLVAVEQGVVVGTAKMGPNRPGRGAHVATASFMVHPDHQGRGVGRALADHVLRQAQDDGYRSIQFNAVVETNTAAVRLWQSLGFEVVGTVPEAFDHARDGLVGLLVMFRQLGPGRGADHAEG